MKKVLVLLAACLATIATTAIATDYFDATGIPVQRSTISSAEFRTEFAAIETGISDKLPPLVGNGNNWVRINAGGTAMTSENTATLDAALNLSVGTDVQAWDTQLDDIAALSVALNDNFIVADGANWTLETSTEVKTSLGLVIGTNVQAWDEELDEIAALPNTDGNFMVGNGTVWTAENAAAAAVSMGVGTTNSPFFLAVNVGDATDTTLTRLTGGVLGVEGEVVPTQTTGSFSVDFDDACTTTPSYTWNYVRHGNIVSIDPGAGDGTCTSDSSNFQDTSTPVPAAIRPTGGSIYIPATVINDTAQDTGCVILDTDGTVRVLRTTGTQCNLAWTASGTKSAWIGSFSYILH